MSTIAINKDNPGKGNITVKKNMKDYSNEPYFVKKAEKAMAFLKKHGLPKSISKKTK